jgi:hypothetical protein
LAMIARASEGTVPTSLTNADAAGRSANSADYTGRMRASELANWEPSREGIETILDRAEIEDCTLLPTGSNYVFLVRLRHPVEGIGLAVYKPRRGEAPLWDFPDGTLYRRERAAYLVARDLGWDFVPPTIIRDGPYGIGMVQLFIPNDPRANFFTLRDDHAMDMRRMALFDAVCNNADRKGGHCLLGTEGGIWGIDHGLTFHESNKLRTVIWDYSDEPISSALIGDIEGLVDRLDTPSTIREALRELLQPSEIHALRNRIERLLRTRVYPRPGSHRAVPWPPV